MRNWCVWVWVGLFCCVSPGTAGVKPIGDFSGLENWSGLTESSERAPGGDPVARLAVPGTAEFEYTEPQTYLSGETPDFSDMLEEVAVEDWYDYRFIEFWVQLPDERAFRLECTLFPLVIGRPDYVESLSSTAVIQGAGWQNVVLALRDFDYHHHQGTFWKYIKGVSLSGSFADDDAPGDVLLSQPRLKQGKVLHVSSPIRSKPVRPDEMAVYNLRVTNETPEERRVSLRLEETAWEACPAELSQADLVLAPWESTSVSLSVTMNDRVAPGGREHRKVTVIPDGRGDLKEELTLITVRHLPHPYLLHTEAGWQQVMQKAEQVDWAGQARQDYVDAARGWRVPRIRTSGYCYKLNDAIDLVQCAIGWKISGEDALARKVIQFLRDFTDPVTGYPSTLRCNNGAKVHRGMFFMHVARSYDLLHDHEELTPQDHEQIEQTMRLYSRMVDSMVLTGDGNNHQAALVAGALLNALVMQDFAEVDRYLHGTGGFGDLLRAGILDDGHYFEGTANYNILTANICSSVAVAFEPWGIDVKNWKIPPRYGKFLMVSDWAMRGDFLGMSFERQGPSTRNVRQLKDLWDAVLPMSDYRGVVFPTSDSVAIDLTDGHNEAGYGFDMAYYLWRDPAYVPLLKIMKKRDLLYGVADLPDVPSTLGKDSYYSDNVGFAVLRSKAEGKEDRERIQAVQRYGTHGGYHGHFDKTSLASLSRYGRTHYGTEASWYGYWSFMFKMWVQTSDSHNMVVVDHRMQKPRDARQILFHAGNLMQVSATEIEAEWIDPPYGGQTPYALKMPEEKAWQEARWLPTPENPRPQGDTGIPSEPVLQRRLMVVTDDYVVLSDYLKSDGDHDFDNLFNCKGMVDITAPQMDFIKHTSQCDPNPYRSAQFITACDWYRTAAPVKAEFVLDWSKGDMGGRNSHSESGILNVDYYSLWPEQAEVMTGNYAESLNVARHLFYKVIGDGRVLTEGNFAPWILGKADLDVDVRGVRTLEIETRIEKASERRTILLGSPTLTTAVGERMDLENVPVDTDNIAPTETNKDYAGGKVSIFGDEHLNSLAAEPSDRKSPGKIVIHLEGQNAVRFQATLGGDYPVGGDDIHRKIIATRTTGNEARFLSAIELYEDNPVIRSIRATSPTELVVERMDGRTETISIKGFDGDGSTVSVAMRVEENGAIIASEQTR